MSFYSLIEKNEFKGLIKEAKKATLKNALLKLKQFDPMNETFFKEMMPDSAPKILIKKRVNKLLLKKREKELKKLLG